MNEIHSFQHKIFKFVFLFASAYYIALHIENLTLDRNCWVGLAGALLYICSHLLRSIRLRFIISSADFNTKAAICVQFGSAALGNLLFPFAKDILAVYLFYLVHKKEVLKILVSILYLRFFDFLAITPLLFIVVLSGAPEMRGLAMTLFALLISVFLALISLPSLCKLIIDYLIKFSHTEKSLTVIRLLSDLKETYIKMNLNNKDKSFAILIFTFLIWSVELLAIYLISSLLWSKDILTSYFYLLGNVLTNIPFVSNIEIPRTLYACPYLALVSCALILITFVLPSLNEKNTKAI